MGSRPKIRNWNDRKNVLHLTFGDQKNLNCLVKKMLIIKPFKNESFINFDQHFQKYNRLIASKLIFMNLPYQEYRFIIKNNYELVLEEEHLILAKKHSGYLQN